MSVFDKVCGSTWIGAPISHKPVNVDRKNNMLRIFATMMLIAVGIPTAAAQDQGNPSMPASGSFLPKDVAVTVSKLLALSQQELSRPPLAVPRSRPSIARETHLEFLGLLSVLNKQVDHELARKVAESSTVGIDCNLIAIARDYSKHPKHYEQLAEHYRMADPRPRGLHPEAPEANHATEEYRPAWELLLLSPCSQECRFARPVFFQTIGTIGNDASIPLLVYLYEQANIDVKHRVQDGRTLDDHSLDEQLLVLQTLNSYCDSAALHAMLRCVAMSESIPSPLPKTAGFTMKEWAMRLLQDQKNNNENPWRKVIERVLQDDKKLSDKDRLLLNEVLQKSAHK
jgi:hypothetical protein